MRVALARGELPSREIQVSMRTWREITNQVAQMDALPRDVLVQILSQLPVQDVISLSQVSRGMLEASQDDRVWVRREEWRTSSWTISVPQRAVGKWVGTVLGLPWQVIARCMRIQIPAKAYDEVDIVHADANPNLTRCCILPCSVWVDFTRHGPLGAVDCLLYTSPSPRD